MGSTRLTKLERHWIYYDIGNSAFILLATTIIPIVFNNLAKGDLNDAQYLAYWGYGVSASTLITAILGPILGAISDRRRSRKRFFTIFMLLGVVGCVTLPLWSVWIGFLLAYVVTKVGFNGSLVFYDAMLTDVSTDERMDTVSSHGFAWGYIGSVIPFVISILLISYPDKLGIDMAVAVGLVFALNGVWWLLWSLPLLKNYRQKYSRGASPAAASLSNTAEIHGSATHTPQAMAKDRSSASASPTSTDDAPPARRVFHHMAVTYREIVRENPKVFYFLLAFFFYIDGVYTIINMATAYGTSLGLSQNGLVLALLVTQIVAFPCALLFSRLSKTQPSDRLIKICIVAYALIALYGVQLDKLYEFWILAVAVGGFQGAIQALSRSYYAKIIPPEKSGEYFGIYDIFGKGASLVGTLLVSVISHITGHQQLAIFALTIMFIIGYIFFHRTTKLEVTKVSETSS